MPYARGLRRVPTLQGLADRNRNTVGHDLWRTRGIDSLLHAIYGVDASAFR
jgi:hypothetical protein